MKKLVLVAAISAVFSELAFIVVLLWGGRIDEINAVQVGIWLGGTVAIWLFSLLIGLVVYFARRRSGDPNRGQLAAFIAAMAFAGFALAGALR